MYYSKYLLQAKHTQVSLSDIAVRPSVILVALVSLVINAFVKMGWYFHELFSSLCTCWQVVLLSSVSDYLDPVL